MPSAPVFLKKGRKVNNYDLYANHAWYVPGVKGMFALLAWFLAGNLLGSLVILLLGMFLPAEAVETYGMLVTYPLSFLPAMVYAAYKSQRNSLFESGYKLNSSHFGPFKAWQMALIAVALTFALSFAADYPNYLNFKLTSLSPGLSRFYDLTQEVLRQLVGGPFWSSFLLAAVFAPVFEEWLCRGMVLRGLLTRLKPAWAIVISALFFALIHMNPWQALNAFIIGVIMGYVYYKTGSLWLTMLMHFVNNGMAVVMAQFPSMQDTEYWLDVLPVPAYIAVVLGAVAVLLACIMAFRRIPLMQSRGNIDTVTLEAD